MSTYYTNGIKPTGYTLDTVYNTKPCPHCDYNITFQGPPPRRNTCTQCSPWLYLNTDRFNFYTQNNNTNSTTITYPKWTPSNITITNATFDFKIID